MITNTTIWVFGQDCQAARREEKINVWRSCSDGASEQRAADLKRTSPLVNGLARDCKTVTFAVCKLQNSVHFQRKLFNQIVFEGLFFLQQYKDGRSLHKCLNLNNLPASLTL